MKKKLQTNFCFVLIFFGFIYSNPIKAEQSSKTYHEAGELKKLVVTAQKKESHVMQTPLSVSLISDKMVESLKIDDADDLQLHVSGLRFQSEQFTGAGFSIRGYGNFCLGASCSQPVAAFQDSIPFGSSSSYLRAIDLLDIERIEVLKGPQGTLYGATASAGIVNFITKKPTDKNEGYLSNQIGDYNSYKIKAMLNLSLTDKVKTRFSGLSSYSDGDVINHYNQSKIDGEGLLQLRNITSVEVFDQLNIETSVEMTTIDNTKPRYFKQLCNTNSTFGCDMTNPKNNTNKLVSGHVHQAGEFNAYLSFLENQLPNGNILTDDLRQGRSASYYDDIDDYDAEFNPSMKVDRSAYSLKLNYEFKNGNALTYLIGLSDYNFQSMQDFDFSVSGSTTKYNGSITTDLLSLGSQTYTSPQTIDRSATDYQSQSHELRFSHILSEKIELLNGFSFIITEGDTNYEAEGSDMHYWGDIRKGPAGNFLDSDEIPVGGAAFWTGIPDTQNPGQYLVDGYAVYVNNESIASWETDQIAASNQAVFDAQIQAVIDNSNGQITDTSTAKTILYQNWVGSDPANATQAGQYIAAASNAFVDNIAVGHPQFGTTALGTQSPFYGLPVLQQGYRNLSRYKTSDYGLFSELYYQINEKLTLTTGIRLIQFQYQDDQLTGLLDLADDFAQQNGNRSSISRTSRDTGKVDAMTYKLGLDYIFKENMLYGFYAKGFKPKGFNPVNDPNLTRFDSETNDYIELGYKSQLLKGKLNLDTALFYNSINDLQVSKIIGRTSIVDNADASIMGIDSNMSISLPFNIRLNSSLSLIDSKIKHLKTKDPQFPYGYDVTIDQSVNNGEPVSTLIDTAQSNPGGSAADIDDGSASTYVTTLLVNGEQKPMYSSFGDICTQYFTFIPVPSCPDTDGVELDLKNNKLPGTSDISFSFGLEKTFNEIWSRQLSTRLDYIWKGSYYTDLFNRDFLKVPGYDEINLEVRYQPQSRKWVSKFYIKNLQNTRNVTNYSMMSVAAGSPIYAFYLKPRTYGFSFTYHF